MTDERPFRSVDQDALVVTRIMPPVPARNSLVRARLSASFASAERARLLLVSAPPGMGKTTAVRHWVEHVGRPVAWLTVDADDNDPLRFWTDVATAIDRVAPGITTAHPDPDARLATAHRGGSEVLAHAERIEGGLVLVLDDFQALTNLAVIDELRAFLEHKSQSLEVVVASRADPPLPLARWRVRDELCEIRESDLRFRLDEAAAYLAMFHDLTLDEHAVVTLTARTEGWIAGLQLAVVSLRASGDQRAFIDRFSGTDRYVADFLLQEVLERQPEDVCNFLLETSVLDVLAPSLCDAVTRRDDAYVLLRRLEAANLFVTRIDAAGTSFRYHPLFRDLLRFDLESRRPERARQVREDAAGRLADTGDRTGAVELFVAAGNHEAALALALPDESELSPAARATASARLDLVSTTFVAESVERMLVFADAIRKVGRLDDSAMWLRRAGVAQRADRDRGDDDRFQARCEALWSKWYAADGDAHAAVGRGNEARRRTKLRDRPRDPFFDGLEHHLARAWLLLGSTDSARRCIDQTAWAREEPVAREVSTPALLARVDALEGHLRDAEIGAARALHVAAALGAPRHPATIDALLARAFVRRERDDLVGAAADLDAALALATDMSSPPYIALARIEQARILATTVGPAEAAEYVRTTRADASEPVRRSLAGALGIVDAELALRCGDLDRALQAALTVPVRFEREAFVASVDIASGHADRARERLRGLDAVHLRDHVRLELLNAVAASDMAQLRHHLAVAAALAAPEGFRRLFTNGGPGVVAGLRSLAAAAELDPFAAELVATLSELPAPPVSTTATDVLSEREHGVLRYLGTTLSYYEIATELEISVNTVKTHVKSIHRKLDVSSRADAVARARELGMLRGGRSPTLAMG